MFRPSETLGEDGPFSRHITDFAPRQQQQLMADAVGRSIESGETLIVEAGTGVGKTYAYLVPALLSGRKTIISTGTKNLQDQLFNKDLPLVREALASGARTALLKGRANYLCLQRMDLADEQAFGYQHKKDLTTVRAWSRRTSDGDIAEVSGLAEDSPVWLSVTSTADNCVGQECPHMEDCYVFKARRKAQEADLVVINHHLLMADMSLKEEGFGDLLPDCDAFILDEAHQLPDIAPNFFGQSITSRQLMDLARDSIGEQIKEVGDMPAIPDAAHELEKAVRDMRLAFGQQTQRAPWKDIAQKPAIRTAVDNLTETLMELQDCLEPAAPRGKGLEACYRRSMVLVMMLKLMEDHVVDQPDAAEDDDPMDEELRPKITGYIHWFETFARGFSIYLTPLNISEIFSSHMNTRKAAWVFTSATLAVGEKFDHFSSQLGLTKADSLHLDSPFDYTNNALLYLPKSLPEPNAHGYVEAVVEMAIPFLELNRGRAFLLFTSHRALQAAAELLEQKTDFELFSQGSAPKDELLSRFRESSNAVLLGASSFWEGVDVRGAALSLVIIDKLPFASPGDPVLQARIEAMKKEGTNAFMDYQLPNAVISLKQGVGRLIRDVNDKGVMVLCDPRLIGKRYGKMFLNSLPAMKITRADKEVDDFIRQLEH